MEINIRPYEERDLAALTKCLEDLQDHEAGVDPIGYVVRKEGFVGPYVENIFKNVAEKDGIIYVAEREGKVIGIAASVIQPLEKHEILARSVEKPYGHVLELYVIPEFRSQNVGASLLAKAEEYFREKECKMSLLYVFTPNIRAHEFYKKNGYTERSISLLKQL